MLSNYFETSYEVLKLPLAYAQFSGHPSNVPLIFSMNFVNLPLWISRKLELCPTGFPEVISASSKGSPIFPGFDFTPLRRCRKLSWKFWVQTSQRCFRDFPTEVSRTLTGILRYSPQKVLDLSTGIMFRSSYWYFLLLMILSQKLLGSLPYVLHNDHTEVYCSSYKNLSI